MAPLKVSMCMNKGALLTTYQMEKSYFFIALAAILFLNNFAQSSGKTFFNLTTDKYALLALKNTTLDPHGFLANWSTITSICYWTGVACSTKHQRVAALDFSGFGLRGTLSPHLGNLTFLQYLDISFNNFEGSIPPELSNLRRLKEINVGINLFKGEIPSWFGILPQLQHLLLNNNSFSGRIPPSLFNISSKLLTLDVSYNSIDGNIPREIGNFSSLETINLGNNQFSGYIPYGIFNMSSIRDINLGNNSLSGSLPSDLCNNIPKLKALYLSRNQLFGQIPPNIHNCRDLEDLRLAENHFNGNIPSEIGSLTGLKVLSLWSNELTGHLPKELGNLTSLKLIYVGRNNLTGEFPEQLGNIALKEVSTSQNFLSGSIPLSIFNISTLTALELSFNNFSGNLPSTVEGISLPNLYELYLHHNMLSGTIPSYITNASKLSILDMNSNSFSASFPNFGNLRLLRILELFDNNLTGGESANQELTFLTSLTNCQQLEILSIAANPLNGVLPASIGNLSASLQLFRAFHCNIKGPIPSEFGNLTSLLSIVLYSNKLTGFIPPTFGKLKQLQLLFLVENQLQGSIPPDLCQMSVLGSLYLSDNMLTGPIPGCLGDLKFLSILYLGGNKLNGIIPPNIWHLRGLLALTLDSNYLNGNLSSQVGSLKAIEELVLSFNQLSGDIPSSIDGCQSLEILRLSNNKFQGSIPQSVGKVKSLTTLDLSNNNLSGLIPKSLEDLHFLQYFNVSYNILEGEIPTEGPFVNFTAQSFIHNSALCGASRFQVSPCIANHTRSRPKNVVRSIKYIVPPIFSVFILVIVILMLIKRRKQKKIPPNADVSIGVAWKRISYRELVQRTSNFSETNLLGRGSFSSVFKGTLSDGFNVAVKVFNLQLEGAIKSFNTESEILSSIRHRNLVRIIGCCSNQDFKALILAYMPNGSLEKWLYSDNYFLDLTQRLQIAIDVALALEYLHHGHTFPVVHCDLKPSNVLLDEDMIAHVGDFGISKLFGEGEAVIQTKTLGTIGYTAPEYGTEGKVSTSGDVYSYGIILLEMFTGKKPIDDMFSEEMSLKDWVSKALQDNVVTQVVAPGLLAREYQDFLEKEECVSSIFVLAMECLAISPEDRINMIETVATLKKIKGRVVAANTRPRQFAISMTSDYTY